MIVFGILKMIVEAYLIASIISWFIDLIHDM